MDEDSAYGRPDWAGRVSLGLIRRLYEMDARGIHDLDLINEVGYALLARCEAIRRVTYRLCPECGGEMDGAFGEKEDRYRRISCRACGWSSTWQIYHRSYKGRRIHGGRAFPTFMAFMDEFPKARSPQEKMLCIDRLVHALHEDIRGVWVLPGVVNLVAGKPAEIARLLDALAGLSGARPEMVAMNRQFRQKLVEGEAKTRRHARTDKPTHEGGYFVVPLEGEEDGAER